MGRAGEALASIVDKVAHISTLMSDMAEGAGQQSIGLGEITIGVTQLDQVTQQNAAMAEESSAASHSLHQEATALAALVGHFKTTALSGGGSVAPRNRPGKQRQNGQGNSGTENRFLPTARSA